MMHYSVLYKIRL